VVERDPPTKLLAAVADHEGARLIVIAAHGV
jgi:hypothetical protein